MSWETVQIKDICKKVTSGGTPLTSKENYYFPYQIPWVKTKEVNYCRITDTETYISQEGLDNSSAKLIPENSVIVAMYGQGDTAGRVAVNKIPVATNQACCNLIIDESKADYRFIYYKLSTMYEKLVSLKNGGAQPNLNAAIIKNLEIIIPNLELQQNIANILSTYDDLIENNQKQIKLLEEAAQRLYKEWFVDLRFPGYENTPVIDGVPQGWRVLEIGDAFKTLLGGTPSREKSEYWKNGTIPWINSGKVNELRVVQPSEYITAIALNKSATKLLPKHTTLVAITGATLGQVSYTEIETCTNQSVVGIIDATQTYSEYVYCYVLDNIKRIIGKATGGAQQHINKDIVNKFPIVIPEESISSAFQNIAKPYFEKINALLVENIKLAEARDRLLPKLISGEIEV